MANVSHETSYIYRREHIGEVYGHAEGPMARGPRAKYQKGTRKLHIGNIINLYLGEIYREGIRDPNPPVPSISVA
jgi:hypothetical protein